MLGVLILINGTINMDYSVGDFTFGLEYQLEEKQQDTCKTVTKLSR